MTKQFARPVMRLAVVMALALTASACETVSDTVSALDPTTIFDGSDTAPLPADDANAAPSASADTTVDTPNLAALPPRPAAPDATAQTQAAQQVAAAGAQAQYSANALRAGTEAAAPPPLAPGATPAATPPTAAPVTQSALDAPPTAEAGAVAAASPLDSPPTAEAAAPPSAVAPAPAPVLASNAPPAAAPAATPAPVPAPARTATLAPPPGAEPAVPAVPPAGSRGALIAANPSDAALGFKRSSAPALDSDIAKWVAAPILTHYRQTAARAGSAGVDAGTAGVSGNVMANLNAAPGTPAGMAAAMNGGVAPAEIIYFAGDGVALSVKARKQVADAAAAFKANGSTGSVKVVGHASSRTGNMSIERHMELIFAKSQQRANAVAQALIRAGVPAANVQVEAVGDSQPIYYESMPKGEEGNRRAEIYLQG